MILYREEEHPVCVRPNFTRLSDAEFEALLQEKGWRAERGLAPHAWLIYGAGDLAATRITVPDASPFRDRAACWRRRRWRCGPA